MTETDAKTVDHLDFAALCEAEDGNEARWLAQVPCGHDELAVCQQCYDDMQDSPDLSDYCNVCGVRIRISDIIWSRL